MIPQKNNKKQDARLVKAAAAPASSVETDATDEAGPLIVYPLHPDRALWEEIVGYRWSELRTIYRRVFGRAPTCKNCGHKL